MSAERIALEKFLDCECVEHSYVLERIASGAVFVYPTETIYGIGGNGLTRYVAQRVLSIKRRPPENPFILIGSKQSCFEHLQPQFTNKINSLTQAFWPGPLTLILQCGNPPIETAVRVTDHPFIIAVNEVLDFPLISTSANISGEPYNPDPDVIFDTFRNDVDFMIDGGKLPYSKPSTVVKAMQDAFTIIREGAIPADAVERCLLKA